MNNDFLCPKCRGQLGIGDEIVLTVQNPRKHGGLILLHAQPGNYEIDHHPMFDFFEGEKLDFFCPICHHKLDAEKHRNLARLIMTGESGQEYDIYFSKIAGEKSTFVMIGEHAEYFGEHAPNYEDYFTFIQMA